ncbi:MULTISPECIES: hypothetical protein [unclassified Microbacterium]|uniref:hypothetical protein n=1 Tax=unclassified Microbacterium TaxID=2609290 RepID=UPI000EAA58B4|nr:MULTISPECIES: hypothetical protein [unclassified Microbacterium]MBT2483799.1 hypothetical protein [Microbacterium sp. ISL-108]RKN66785.1 hypothetical protein D7252_03705 [Microbacterium sp. CGR2]
MIRNLAVNATRAHVRRWVGRAEVPPALASLATLPGYHYVDAFTLDWEGADEWTAGEWARAMFEDDRPILARAATRGLLGVMLNRPDPRGLINGFTIALPDRATLRGDVRSNLSADQIVVSVTPAQVSLVTAVRHNTPIAKAIWTVVSNLHRSFAPRVLRYAATELRGLSGSRVSAGQGRGRRGGRSSIA